MGGGCSAAVASKYGTVEQNIAINGDNVDVVVKLRLQFIHQQGMHQVGNGNIRYYFTSL